METNNIKSGCSIAEQLQEIQDWFNTEILPKIDFAESCSQRDEWQRPSKWIFDNIVVEAVYYTQNENYNFNQFLIFNVE